MSKTKKLVAIFLSLLMVFSAVPSGIFADNLGLDENEPIEVIEGEAEEEIPEDAPEEVAEEVADEVTDVTEDAIEEAVEEVVETLRPLSG